MFFRHNVFGIFFVCLIAVGCLLPGPELPKAHMLHMDKFVHVTLFAALCFCLIVGFTKQSRFLMLKMNALKTAVIFSFLYGILIEIIQHFFIPKRTFELYDILADTLGVLIGFMAFRLIVGREKYCNY